jgi:type VI secretion system protein ImpE
MKAKTLLEAGKLNEAIEALNGELRDNPGDVQRRTFLFELLCYAGNYDRAEKQLALLNPADDPKIEMGALLYRAALHAERERQAMFAEGKFPGSATPDAAPGRVNGKAALEIEDGDTRIGARLELFAAGQYMWLPFRQIARIKIEPPKRLRDLLWLPAVVHPVEGFAGAELGEVILPAIAAGSIHHADANVRLGRVTEWIEIGENDAAPLGQKLLIVDGEQIPLLEIREIEFNHPVEANALEN